MDGGELEKLALYKDSLRVLKMSNNKITTLDQLKALKPLDKLIQLDISDNKLCLIDDYRTKVLEILPKLDVLDGYDRDGASFCSDDDMDEMGEYDVEDEFGDMLKDLDPETRKKVENGELSIEELETMGLLKKDEDYGSESEDGESENTEGNKRQRKD